MRDWPVTERGIAVARAWLDSALCSRVAGDQSLLKFGVGATHEMDRALEAGEVDEARTWARLAVRAHEHFADVNDSDPDSAMGVRVRLVLALGPQPGDPVRSVESVCAWLLQLVAGTSPEIVRSRALQVREAMAQGIPDLGELRSLRRIKNALRPVCDLSEAGIALPDEAASWVSLRHLLP